MRSLAISMLVVVLTAHALAWEGGSPQQPSDVAATEAWRASRERDLRADDGWLTVSALAFLEMGENSVGSAPSSRVVLPAGAPPRAGTFVRTVEATWFDPADGVALTNNGKPVTDRIAVTPRDRIAVGNVAFHLHASGDRLGVRVRDPNSDLRRSFTGLRWFPVRKAWTIQARFEPYAAARQLTVPNVLGDFERLTILGDVVFRHQGREVRLEAAQAGRRLWIIFSDALGGRETYRIRFLYADLPDANARVTLDFNRAYNPPCAYNPFTTCPLPPSRNRLAFGIPAGERLYAPH